MDGRNIRQIGVIRLRNDRLFSADDLIGSPSFPDGEVTRLRHTGLNFMTLTLFHRLVDESWTRVFDTDRLNLLVKHPTCVVAYWEVSQLRKKIICQHFQSDWNQLPLRLRIHDVTDMHFDGYAAHATSQFDVHSQDDHWYIRNLQPDRNYLVDFGTTTIEGQFVAILRSSTVRTPRVHTLSEHPETLQFQSPGWRPEPVEQEQVVSSTSDASTGSGTPPYANQFTGYGSITR